MNPVFWLLVILMGVFVWAVLFPLVKMAFKLEEEWEKDIEEDRQRNRDVDNMYYKPTGRSVQDLYMGSGGIIRRKRRKK